MHKAYADTVHNGYYHMGNKVFMYILPDVCEKVVQNCEMWDQFCHHPDNTQTEEVSLLHAAAHTLMPTVHKRKHELSTEEASSKLRRDDEPAIKSPTTTKDLACECDGSDDEGCLPEIEAYLEM